MPTAYGRVAERRTDVRELSAVAYATEIMRAPHRGLKSTATIIQSLRDHPDYDALTPDNWQPKEWLR
jgi:hypothetical protein